MSSSPPTNRRLLALGIWVLAAPLGANAVLAQSPDGGSPVVAAVGSPTVDEARADLGERLPVTTTTRAPGPTTTVAPTTTAPPPPPTTAAPAAPAPTASPTVAPAPAPAAAPAAVPSAEEVYQQAVPSAWRAAFSVRFELIDGSTSWASSNGVIKIAAAHRANRSVLAATIAHEFGHLIAWRYGTQAFNGAAPEGWPSYSGHPQEAWADCVSQVFTGITDPSHGLPGCSGVSLSWTHIWLGAGPNGHPRTA